MSNSQKVVISVLAAVVALFVLALVMQGRAGDGDASAASQDDGLLRSFADRFAGSSDAEHTEISSPCLDKGGLLEIATRCDLTVAPSDKRLRLVRLRAVDGGIRVLAPGPEGADFTITKELDANQMVSVAVDRNGATITVVCPSPIGVCTMQLVEG